MKNLTSKSLLIICLVLGFLLFQECQKNNDSYKEPIGLISLKKAEMYEKNYLENQYKFINEKLNQPLVDTIEGVDMQDNKYIKDSRAIRFSLEELENYIKYVKAYTDKEYAKDEISLRVYFGAKNVKFEKDKDSVMRSTLFFIPTVKEVTRNTEAPHQNINQLNPLNYGSAGDPDSIEYKTKG
ncbi:hypothetical protein V6251_04830 [Olleya sp. Ti.3.14]|uniref:hypothetical protein n=1 Tax=Olleya sp. Ti.3.14 TaxID=3121297 RepID=UPI00311E2BAF